MLIIKLMIAMALVLAAGVKAQSYVLNYTYDATNWYDAWTFEDGPDPTHGLVEYQSLENAQSLGLTKIVGNQVYMGVDNTTVIPTGTTTGRKSIWLESKTVYDHYLLIADFEHMPGSDCGTWPGFWSINQQNYGEIDIVEGANNQAHNCMTLHTLGECSFFPRNETGVTNGDQCSLSQGDAGCDTQGGQYGTGFNNVGGGVYATLWNSAAIQIFFWERADIPEDIASGDPKPDTWGIPLAQFAAAAGGCDIDTNFKSQTLYFDTTFCGANAGGEAWTTWSNCAQTTGVSTCEEYVQAHPEAFDDAYWLVNYVKVFSESTSPVSSAAPPPAPATSSVAPPPAFSPVAGPTTLSSVVSPVSEPSSSVVPASSISSASPTESMVSAVASSVSTPTSVSSIVSQSSSAVTSSISSVESSASSTMMKSSEYRPFGPKKTAGHSHGHPAPSKSSSFSLPTETPDFYTTIIIQSGNPTATGQQSPSAVTLDTVTLSPVSFTTLVVKSGNPTTTGQQSPSAATMDSVTFSPVLTTTQTGVVFQSGDAITTLGQQSPSAATPESITFSPILTTTQTGAVFESGNPITTLGQQSPSAVTLETTSLTSVFYTTQTGVVFHSGNPTSTIQAASPSSTMAISKNGSCGDGVTCYGSAFGNCCSSKGYCGSNTDYCGQGCQSALGFCSTQPPVPSGLAISDYGNCGGNINTTCLNSVFGNCCSRWGFCGSSQEYCGKGCQSGFGTCS